MADGTKIEWTDATWNPITGCSVTSPGCTNCYAMQLAGTRLAHLPSRAGLTREVNGHHVWTGKTRLNEQWLDQPLRWRKPRRIFVCAHGDLFHESVPDVWIDRVFAVMALAPQHTFQVLTKRASRMREYIASRDTRIAGNEITTAAYYIGSMTRSHAGLAGSSTWPLPNIWLGVSVEDQVRANERVPELLATPAAVRWISAEPLLGPIDLTSIDLPGGWNEIFPLGQEMLGRPHVDDDGRPMTRLNWVVVGGESGPGARPMHPDWARSLRDQCAAADVPFLFKQWGEWRPGVIEGERHAAYWPLEGQRWSYWDDIPHQFWTFGAGAVMARVGKKTSGRLLDGREHNAFPEVANG